MEAIALVAALAVAVPPIDQIVDREPGVRQQAWQRLLLEVDVDELVSLLPRINQLLAGAGDRAFDEGAERLRDLGLWGWETQPRALILREMDAAALSADDARHELAASTMTVCPLDLETDVVLRLTDMLVLSGTPELRRAALDAACLWAGRERAASLAALTIVDDDLERDRLLAVSWSSAAPAPGPAPGREPGLPGVWADDDPDLVEAALLAHLRLDPGGPALLARLRDAWETSPRPAFEALEALGSRATPADGTTDLQPPGSLAADASAPLPLRRLAARRLPSVPAELLPELLASPVADAAGHVYATVLLAERFLDRPAAVAAAEQWIRSLDDDQKRCGALLAMLSGGPRELLAEAYAAEDVPEVKRVQRLALGAMSAAADPVALDIGVRTLEMPGGDFDPDVALALLAAGHVPALAALSSQPRGDGWDEYCRSVQARCWLVERMVPGWHATVGRPLVADPRGVRLHFDDLRAFRLLTQRRLAFDRESLAFSG